MVGLQATVAQWRRILALLCVLALAVLVVVAAVAGASRRDASAQPGGKMYWTDPGAGKIQRANLDGSDIEDVITGLDSVRDIEVDPSGGKIYWLEAGQIRRANLDGSGIEDIDVGPVSPSAIALDWVAGKVYWLESPAQIRRADYDGTNVEDVLLLEQPEFPPYDLAVDGYAGKVYWAEFSSIYRANLDGSGIEHLDVSHWFLNDMQTDVTAGKIYWTEAFANYAPYGPMGCSGSVSRANGDGTGHEDLATGVTQGLALDAQGGKVYWTEDDDMCWIGWWIGLPGPAPENPGVIRRADFDGGNAEDVITEGLVDPGDIALDVPLPALPFSPTPCPPEGCPTTTAAVPSPVLTPMGTPTKDLAGLAAPDSGTGGATGGPSEPLVWGPLAGALGLAGVALLRWGRCARRAE